jgi:glycosyltransferase involved in cell wall biosynthesis
MAEEPGTILASAELPTRVVLLYVGRVSWEKNLILLLRAYGRMGAHLPPGSLLPKLVFVGDGPARSELEAICEDEGYDATFMGHRSGEELAQCYASADVFVFPSFTETFGQVVLEALASGLVSTFC